MKRIFIVLSIFISITSIYIFTGCEKKDKISSVNNEKVEKIQLANGDKENFIALDVYFDSGKEADSNEVSKEHRTINKQELIGQLVIQELIKGPSQKSKLKPLFPKETRLLSFSIKDKTAHVNFSKDIKVKMSKNKEKSCLKGIVYSLTELEGIDKVNICIDNQDNQSIGGNYKLSKSLDRTEVDLLKK